MGTKRKVKTLKSKLAELDADISELQAKKKALKKALEKRGDEEIVDPADTTDSAATASVALDQSINSSFGANQPNYFNC